METPPWVWMHDRVLWDLWGWRGGKPCQVAGLGQGEGRECTPLSRLHPALPRGHAGSKATTWAGKVGRECDLLVQSSSIKDQTIDVRTFLRQGACKPAREERSGNVHVVALQAVPEADS